MSDISSLCLERHFIFMFSCNCGVYTSVWMWRDEDCKKNLETPSFLAPHPYYRVQWFCIHLVRDQWWWLGSCDGCDFCVGTDIILAVRQHICCCIICWIYSQRRICADICSHYSRVITSDPTLSVASIVWEEETVNLLLRKPARQSTLTIAVNTLDRTQTVLKLLIRLGQCCSVFTVGWCWQWFHHHR